MLCCGELPECDSEMICIVEGIKEVLVCSQESVFGISLISLQVVSQEPYEMGECPVA